MLRKQFSYLFTVTLKKWGITDDDLFYVMVRNKEQPGQEVFATLPELDHDIGKSYTVYVYTFILT